MSDRPGEARLKQALARRRARPELKADPTNPFELAMAERLKALEREVDELKGRLNWLFTVIVGAAVTNIVIALVR